jgi:tetratricopeptide (TPR) repeat protein/CHAT domain-containing protein
MSDPTGKSANPNKSPEHLNIPENLCDNHLDVRCAFVRLGGKTLAARLLARLSRAPLALGLLIFLCSACLGEDQLQSLSRRTTRLIEQGKYQEAVPIAETAVAVAKHTRGSQRPETAYALDNLGSLYSAIGEYAKAEPVLKEAVQIRQKILGSEHPDTAASLNNLAELYYSTGENAKAEPLYQEALRIRQKVLGPERPDTATSLNDLGSLYYSTGEYAKAEPLLQESLRVRQKVLGPDNPDTSTSLHNLGLLYDSTGEYAKAEPLLQEALRICRKVAGPENPDTAISLRSLASLYRDMVEYAKAEPLYQEALRIRQKTLGPEHPETATSLNNLASLYDSMGQYSKAKPLYQEALRIRQKVLGPEDPGTVTSLNNLAEFYQETGEYADSEALFQEVLHIRQKVLGPANPDTATSLNNLGCLYSAKGEYAKAEPLLQEALQIRQKVLGSEHLDTALSLINLGSLYQNMGEYAKVEWLLQEALRIRQQILGPEHPDTAESLNSLAMSYYSMGEREKAEPLLRETLRIRQKVLGPEHPDTATSLNNLADLYQDLSDYAKAEPLYQKALRIRQKVLGPEHPDTATSLANLAMSYWAMGEYAKVEPLLQEALRINQKVLGSEHPATASGLGMLGMLYRAMGDYAKAEPFFREAIQIYQKALGSEHPDTVRMIENLAALELDFGHDGEATTLSRQAAVAELKILSRMFSFTSEQQRLAYIATFRPYQLFPVLPGCQADLALALLRYKGVVLDSVIEDRLLAKASTNSEDRDRVERLMADRNQLDKLLLQVAQKPSEPSQQVEKLEKEVERLEAEMAQHVQGLGQARQALGVTVEEVQGCLPGDGALIEYARYRRYLGKGKSEDWYGAIVLLAQGDPRWVPLSDAKLIDKLVADYSRLAAGDGDDDELGANLKALYNAVLAPLEPQLSAGTRRLIVSPDGQLNFVSLATLLTAEGKFLGEKFQIRYVSSGRELLREHPPTAEHNVVMFADPDFDASEQTRPVSPDNRSALQPMTQWRGNEKRSLEGGQFPRLPGTQEESDQLLRLFKVWQWPSQSQSGQNATKAALLEVHSPFVLHLATHGFFEPQDPSQNASEAPDFRPSVYQSKFFANPMHESGLALSGANLTLRQWDRGDKAASGDNDGILTAEDVSTLDLKGTWLVTLSACDTGKGEARAGEGVMGLRRGFAQAGAENLLLTLWAISDETTVQIMSDFYAAAHQSGDAPDALAVVQRDWLVKLRKEQGLAKAVNLAGPFIMSSQGKP